MIKGEVIAFLFGMVVALSGVSVILSIEEDAKKDDLILQLEQRLEALEAPSTSIQATN